MPDCGHFWLVLPIGRNPPLIGTPSRAFEYQRARRRGPALSNLATLRFPNGSAGFGRRVLGTPLAYAGGVRFPGLTGTLQQLPANSVHCLRVPEHPAFPLRTMPTFGAAQSTTRRLGTLAQRQKEYTEQ